MATADSGRSVSTGRHIAGYSGWMYGEEPEEVMHLCDNPPCVDWERCLRAGTHAMNTADRVAKGRSGGASPGEGHHNHKLSDVDVGLIRERYSLGEKQSRLATIYGVDRSTISKIVNKRIRIK